ncbi:MAG: hypothetical protein C4K49_11000 [Candidatus Thorarchaeota archaeon]|nr:MAG: hypothetical protein C4K49_11000 [Candidatus Thorarchaeota archaeon]
MSLREDSDPYCMLWIGVALFAAYYFNFAYLGLTVTGYLSAIAAYLPILLVLPIVIVFLFTGYLKPRRGRYRPTVLALSIFASLFYFIIASTLPQVGSVAHDSVFLSFWVIGGAILIAGAFSEMPSLAESTSPGMLDVSSLQYKTDEDATATESS